MRIRQVVLTSILSSILTVVAMVGLLASTGSVTAQKADPPTDPNAAPVVAPEERDPSATAAQGTQPLREEDTPEAVTQYRHVAGSVFVPLYGDAGVVYGLNGCTYMTSATHGFMQYSLDLPYKSTVTQLRLYFNDTSASANGTLYLAQFDDGATYNYVANVETTGSVGLGNNTASGLDILLDYVNYNYVLYWAPGTSGSAMQLCGFRVGFTPPVGLIQLLPTTLRSSSP